MKIKVTQTLPNGQVTEQVLTKNGTQPLKIQALPGAKLSIQVESGTALEGVSVQPKTGEIKRKGSHLVLESEGVELLEVTDFYATAGASVGDVVWNFAAQDVGVTSATPEAQALASNTAVSGSGALVPVIAPGWLVLGGVGAAAAAGGGGGSSSSGGGGGGTGVSTPDTTPPTATVTDNVTGTANGPVTYTITFSEAVKGFDVSKLTLTGGTLSGFTASADGKTYTVVATPDLATTGTLKLSVSSAGIADTAGNAMSVAPTVADQAFAQNLLQGTIVAGPVLDSNSLSVIVFNAATGEVIGRAPVTGTGTYTVSLDVDFSGPVVLLLIDSDDTTPDYVDEVTREPTDLSGTLLAVANLDSSLGVQTLNINPLTTVAALMAGFEVSASGTSLEPNTSDTSEAALISQIESANTAVAKALGLGSTAADLLTAAVVPTVNTDGSTNANANTYGKMLAVVSGMDSANGGDASKTLNKLVEGISDSGTLSSAVQNEVKTAATIADVAVTDLPAAATGANSSSSGGSSGPTIDTTAPTVSAVAITSATGAQNNTLNAGDVVSVTVTMSEATTVTGTPQLALNIGGTTVQANYASGSGTTALVFNYTILAGQTDANGISLAANALSLNGGTLKDAGGNAATLSTALVADNLSYLVDTTAPTLSSTAPATTLGTAITGTAGNSVGETITLTVTFDGIVNGLTSGTDSTIFKVGGTGVSATWAGTAGTNTRTLTYTVAAGQNGQATIDEAALKTALIAGISDAAGNAFSYTANGGVIANIDATALPEIDTTAPTVSAVAITSATGAQNNTLNAGDVVSVTVTMSEATTVTGTPQLALNIGGTTVQANYASGSGTTALVFNYTILAGQTDANGISLAANALSLNGGTLKDAGGNAATLSTALVADNLSYLVDTTAPTTPVLVLGTGVANGATSAEATAASGAVTVTAETGASTVVTFSRSGGGTLTKTVTGSGATPVAVTLTAADLTTLGNGTIAVSAIATDAAGNASTATNNSFTLDTTAPTAPTAPVLVLGTGVANGATSAEATAASGAVTVTAETGASTVVTFSRSGGGTLTKTVTGSGATPVAVTLTAADLTTLGNGTIAVSAVATDAAGNASTATSTSFTLDTTAPTAPVLVLGTGVSNGATSAEAIAASGAVTVTAETGASTVVTFSRSGGGTLTKTVTGSGATPVAVTLTATDLTTLGNGTIAVSAVATDTAGNASTATSTSFTLDTTAPTAPTAPVLVLGTGVANGATSAEATAASGAVTVTAETGASTVVTFSRSGGGTLTKTVTGSGATPVAVTLTAADLTTLGNGTIAVSAIATDAAGNASTATNNSFTLDAVAPTVSTVTDATAAAVTKAPITFTVNFSEALVGTVGVANFTATNGAVTSVAQVGTTNAYTVVVTPTAGTASGNVTLSLVAGSLTDAAGNAVVNADLSSKGGIQGIDTAAPAAPVLVLGTGVADGATSAEATAASGVVTVTAETGASTVVTFTRVPVENVRYVMLQLDRTNTASWSIGEVQVMVSGVNVALNKTVTVGPQGQGPVATEGAALLVNGDPSTAYRSSTSNVTKGWIEIDLGAAYRVEQILVAASTAGTVETGQIRMAGTIVFAPAKTCHPRAWLSCGQVQQVLRYGVRRRRVLL